VPASARRHAPSSTRRRWPIPNGCHVCEVEIDPETGVVRIDRYVAVNDFGVIVNPLLVEGQAHGGIVQGIGQALLERVAYSEDGQLLTGSYMDYALPRAGRPAELRLRAAAPCPARPTRSAPRAAARRAAPARCRR
jgi:aerobic carbon-monoxide dehydrogenase large subunit